MTRPAKTDSPESLRAQADDYFQDGRKYRRLGRDDEANAAFLSSCEMMDAAGVIEAREAG